MLEYSFIFSGTNLFW